MRKKQPTSASNAGPEAAPRVRDRTPQRERIPGDAPREELRKAVEKLLPGSLTPDREMLRNDLIALYHEHRTDAEVASSMQEEYEKIIEEAREMRQKAQLRAEAIKRLLELEFPEWESPGT